MSAGGGTGVFLALAEEDRTGWSQVRVPVPEGFRFGDVNPVTGTSFVVSRFGELPEFAARVVLDRLDLGPGEWDVCVEDGEADEFVDPDEWFPVAAQLHDVAVPAQRESTEDTDETVYVVGGLGHVQEFHACRSFHPGYTWEQYQQDVARRRGAIATVVNVSSLDDPEAWM